MPYMGRWWWRLQIEILEEFEKGTASDVQVPVFQEEGRQTVVHEGGNPPAHPQEGSDKGPFAEPEGDSKQAPSNTEYNSFK